MHDAGVCYFELRTEFMIELLTITWRDLLHPEFYINNGGLWIFLFIVFAETGLLAGFFLPGDSLLFVAGIYSNELAAYLYDLSLIHI